MSPYMKQHMFLFLIAGERWMCPAFHNSFCRTRLLRDAVYIQNTVEPVKLSILSNGPHVTMGSPFTGPAN